MRYTLYALVLLACTVLAGADGAWVEGSVSPGSGSGGTDDYIITELNSFTPGYVTNIRGIDFDEPDALFFVSGAEYKFYKCSADDGSYLSDWDLDPGNGSPYCMVNSITYANVNDYSDTIIYYFDGGGWDTYANPTSFDGRGMDYDGSYIWEAYSSGGYGVYQFDDSGSVQGSWLLPEIPGQLSGLAVFDSGGNVGIAVTCYNTHNMYFYEFDGTMTYLGMGALPSIASSSLGLCYSETRGTFFWSYNSASGYSISELQVDESALEQSTWGSIKTVF